MADRPALDLTVDLWPERRFGVEGHVYEAACDGFVCAGWADGSEAEAMRAAREHAARVLEADRQRRAAALGNAVPGKVIPKVNGKAGGSRES